MMADKPWFGVGWNKPESTYTQYYRPANVDESMAIELNDFLTLGTTLGCLALLCFLACVAMSFMTSLPGRVQGVLERPGEDAPRGGILMRLAQTTCRAAVVVFLIGFFFDGGLFRMALAIPFWILLELGADGETRRESRLAPGSEKAPDPGKMLRLP